MSVAIRRTSKAMADLESHATYLGLESEALELRFLESANETFRILAKSPELGALYPFDNELLNDVRIWQIKGFRKHLVFY